MKVFLVGTGNVATSLGKALRLAGHRITGVLGRDPEKAARLAAKFGCKAFSDPGKIPVGSAVYLVAIKDDAVRDFISKMPAVKGVVAHTSGSLPMSILDKFANHGVFYPVETITKTRPVSFKKIPLCIEGSDAAAVKKMLLLGKSVSGLVYILDSGQRALLHVAAVFANNFTNSLLGIATGLLSRQQLPASLLRPLAHSTIQNAFEKGTFLSQTGPAVRNDLKTIARHMKMLKGNKNYQDIYRIMTNQIKDVHNKKGN